MRSRLRRPSPAMIIACLALFVALGGTTWAVTSLPASSVGIAQLRTGAVTNTKIGSRAVSNTKIRAGSVTGTKLGANAVTGGKVKNGALTGSDLKANSLTGTQVSESKLGIVPSASKALSVSGITPLATVHIPEAASKDATTGTVLGVRGTFTIYGKCFRDPDGTSTDARIYVMVPPGFSGVFDSGVDHTTGNAYLTSSTPEDDREIRSATATTDSISADTDNAVFKASTGTVLPQISVAGVIGGAFAKNGSPASGGVASGDGPFGAGNSCILGGGALFG